nr:hypothetical protein [Pseudomonas putida]
MSHGVKLTLKAREDDLASLEALVGSMLDQVETKFEGELDVDE